MTYVVGEHPHGLLPPPYYCGRQLRAKKEDFQLPYDLWWMAVNKQLPGRDVAATWNYKRVKNNVYFDVKPWANFDAHACQVWSLTQLYLAHFSQSRVGAKKCVFNKRTF